MPRWLRRSEPGNEPQQRHFARVIAEEPDSWAAMVHFASQPAYRHRMWMAMTPGGLLMTEDRQNLLLLGPPRKGKTAGGLVPLVAFAPGPVVSTSVKLDVFWATAQSRARLGRLWHFAPGAADNELPPPATIPLRWSPIPPSISWGTALSLGKAMTENADVAGGVESGNFFRSRAAQLVATLLHAAAIGGKSMRWMLRAISENNRTLEEAEDLLRRRGADHPDTALATDLLRSLVRLDPRSKASIFSTAALAFAAYQHPTALATTDDPNFDVERFVSGFPTAANPRRFFRKDDFAQALNAPETCPQGFADTIYITSSSDTQSLVAPIVAGLLAEIRRATYVQHSHDVANGFEDRPPVIWALDELANIAPLQDLPSTLSQCADQGLLVAGALQDLSQARNKWGKEADGLLTLFGNVVVFPGILDNQTLHSLSDIVGKEWVRRPHTSYSSSGGSSGGGMTHSEQEHLLPRLDAGDIFLMRAGPGDTTSDPRRVLILGSSGGARFASATPYYNSPPVTQALLASAEHTARRPMFDWRLDLPAPSLTKAGSTAGLLAANGGSPGLVERWRKCEATLEQSRDLRRQWLTWAQHQPWFGSWVDDPVGLDNTVFPDRLLVVSPDLIGPADVAQALAAGIPAELLRQLPADQLVVMGAGWHGDEVRLRAIWEAGFPADALLRVTVVGPQHLWRLHAAEGWSEIAAAAGEVRSAVAFEALGSLSTHIARWIVAHAMAPTWQITCQNQTGMIERFELVEYEEQHG